MIGGGVRCVAVDRMLEHVTRWPIHACGSLRRIIRSSCAGKAQCPEDLMVEAVAPGAPDSDPAG
jgi:hypothetical protein